MPEQLDYQLEIHQSIGNSVPEAGPATVALYYSKTQGAPALHHDIRDDPHFVLVGEEQTHATWAAQSKATGEHGSFNVGSSIWLKDIPRGAELYLRIANHKLRTNVAIDNIQLSATFQLENNDFELPKLRITQAKQQVQAWHYNDEIHTNAHCGPYWSTGSLQAPELLIDHTATDFPNPGFAPVLFKVPDWTKAKKVRITATLLQPELSWRVNLSGHNFAMNEIFLFDGDENVAFNCPSAVSNHSNAPLMFYPSFAVDGYSYFPPFDARKVAKPGMEIIDPKVFPKEIAYDLGSIKSFEKLRLYPVDRSPQFEHIHAVGVGFPSEISVYASQSPARSTARRLLHTQHKTPTGGHPVTIRLPHTEARYVWVALSDGLVDARTGWDALGVAEIELVHQGRNILKGIPSMVDGTIHPKFTYLTDGLSSSGIIRPQKQWLEQLQRRAQLEQQKNKLSLLQEIWNERQQRQSFYLKLAFYISLVLALIVVLLLKLRHQRKLRELRDKIGASLHDEVGANLSSITLSSEILSQGEQIPPEKRRELVGDITRVAQETSTEIRLLSCFLEAQGAEAQLRDQFRRVERQMLPGIHSEGDYTGIEGFDSLIPIEKWELVLFFKEALHNIIKHANASKVIIRTSSSQKKLTLEITDNGQGIPSDQSLPSHLLRRAKSLQGKLRISSPEHGGTTLTLVLTKKRRSYS